MKLLALGFAGLLIGIVLLANQGALPAWLTGLKDFPGGDKVGHFVLMGTMALLLNLSLAGRRIWRIPLGGLLVAVVVTAEELSQIWLPLRSFSWGDLLADYLGILILGELGCWSFRRFPKIMPPRLRRIVDLVQGTAKDA